MTEAEEIAAALSPTRWRWGFWARWWECHEDSVDLETWRGLLPLERQAWWWCEVWETDEVLEACTQGEAVAVFRAAFPWVEHFHVTLLGPVKPPARPTKRRGRRK